MAYQISYGQTMEKNNFQEKHARKNSKLALCIIVFSIVFALLYAAGIENVKKFLTPGDRDVTETALATFVDVLKKGEGVSSAFRAFCEEIIHGAEIS